MLPANAPPEYADREKLWNSAEAVETQWNSQLARKMRFALPREVPNDQWLEMIQDYVQIDELTPEILHRLIKEIVVHEAIDPNGHRNISIEIHYNLRPIDGHRDL